jgi:two-component system, chemotaxis family, sensor kinase CheA
LARNAVLHGIETPDERLGKNKPTAGRMVVTARATGADSVEVLFEDDGRGLDHEAIAAQARALGGTGPAEQVVFHSGLTTATRTDLAGFGVGLGAARGELRKIGYDLSLSPGPTGVRARIAPVGSIARAKPATPHEPVSPPSAAIAREPATEED